MAYFNLQVVVVIIVVGYCQTLRINVVREVMCRRLTNSVVAHIPSITDHIPSIAIHIPPIIVYHITGIIAHIPNFQTLLNFHILDSFMDSFMFRISFIGIGQMDFRRPRFVVALQFQIIVLQIVDSATSNILHLKL